MSAGGEGVPVASGDESRVVCVAGVSGRRGVQQPGGDGRSAPPTCGCLVLAPANLRKHTGQAERQLWQQAHLKEQPALQQWQAGIPSARVASEAEHTMRIQYLYGRGGAAMAVLACGLGLWHPLQHYRQLGQRRGRLTVDICSQTVSVDHRLRLLPSSCFRS